MDVVEKISRVYADEKGKPYQAVRLKHTIILDDPFDDPKGLEELIPDASPEPPELVLLSSLPPCLTASRKKIGWTTMRNYLTMKGDQKKR